MALDTVETRQRIRKPAKPAESKLEALIRAHDGKPFSWAEWSRLPAIDFEERFAGEFETWLHEIREHKGRKS